MKARILNEYLGNQGYIIHDNGDKICVGSPMCSDLISVDKTTLRLTYALDTFNEGRASLRNEILSQIWDKLSELIKSGDIKKYIEGKDDIDPKLPVFWCDEGILKSSYTDKYGWPNTTEEGILMYANTHFDNIEAAIKYGLNDQKIYRKWTKEHIEKLQNEIKEKQELLEAIELRILKLEHLLNSHSNSALIP